jgi:hypothetical protein
MGIDFIGGGKVFVPNLEAGDIVHLMDVLSRVQNNNTYLKLRKGIIEPFTIALTFRRRIVVGAGRRRGDTLVVEYYDRRTANPLFSRQFPRRFVAKLKSILNTLVALYLVVTKMRKSGRKLPKEYTSTKRY